MSKSPVAVEEVVVRRGKVSVPLCSKITHTTPVVQTDLVLTETKVVYVVRQAERKQETQEILLEDLIGVNVIQRPPANNTLACQLEIHSYPLIKSRLWRKASRTFAVAEVQFDSAPTFRDNLYLAMDWKKTIKRQCELAMRREFYFDDTSSSASEEEKVILPRHLLVFINPVGGQGKGVSEFKQHVQPLFDLAEINYNVIVTERQNHAHDVIRGYDVSQIDGIVLASGDGVLYEVVNGLMEREDWEQAIKTPIGMLPTGSGNAICASTLHESNEEFSLTNAAFQIIRGGVIPMDVATMQLADGGRCYMSLLCSWGFVADVDIESEKWRRIGELRFVLGALNCIRKKRVYRGKLQYLPCDVNPAEQPTSDMAKKTTHQTSQTLAPDRHCRELHETDTAAVSSGENGTDDIQTTIAKPGDTVVDTAEQSAPIDIESHKLDLPSRDAESSLYPDSYQQAMSETSRISPAPLPAATNEHDGDILEESSRGKETTTGRGKVVEPRTDLLPALSDPVPDSWMTIDGEFNNVSILMTSHMAHGIFGHPDMTIGSGKFTILYATGNLSRLGMLYQLKDSDTGDHIYQDNVHAVHAKAIRLEPITTPGMLTVDGEVIPYGPMQSQLHSHLGRLICRKRRA